MRLSEKLGQAPLKVERTCLVEHEGEQLEIVVRPISMRDALDNPAIAAVFGIDTTKVSEANAKRQQFLGEDSDGDGAGEPEPPGLAEVSLADRVQAVVCACTIDPRVTEHETEGAVQFEAMPPLLALAIFNAIARESGLITKGDTFR